MGEITNIVEQLKRDEGLRLVPYRDTKGFWTGGYGHCFSTDGGTVETLTIEQAEAYLTADIAHATTELTQHLPWSTSLSPVIFGCLQNLAFNMGCGIPGKTGLLAFTHTLACVQAGQYEEAAAQLLNSKWATEVGDRATRLATQLKTGSWQ